MSLKSSTGASASAASIAAARHRRSGCSSAAATSNAAAITPALGRGPLKAAIAVTFEMIPYSLPYPAMRPVKLAALALAAASILCACGSVTKPANGRGRVDDPRTTNPDRVACLRSHHLPVQELGRTELQIGPAP